MDKPKDNDQVKVTKVPEQEWQVIEMPDGSILHRNLKDPSKTFRDTNGD